MDKIEKIEEQISGLRERLKNHELYYHLSEVRDIKIFMEKHVYAVWDFMSLLKALQQQLTCVSVPWKPSSNAKTARFINEIVMGEESDIDVNGTPISHYQMYIDAMKEVGANTNGIDHFLNSLRSSVSVLETINQVPLHPAVKDFLKLTFETIATGKPHLVAAAFTFGREDLIPDMFIEIVGKAAKKNATSYPRFMYYLNRHIEIDGDEHGPLSLKMVSELCGEDALKWQEAAEVAQKSLAVRIALWDAIDQEIKTNLVS